MNKYLSLTVVLILFLLSSQVQAQSYPFGIRKSIYHKRWIDLNKNDKKDPYENSDLSIKKRVNDLLGRMTMDEKTAQLATLYGYNNILKDAQPKKYWKDTTWSQGIANIDEHLNGKHGSNSSLFWPPARHAEAMNNVQRFFIEQTRLGIPVDFTNEGLRGLRSYKATRFPLEIGQGSTWDPSLINKIGHIEGQEARALGYTNVYSPLLGLSRDPRWGRALSTYGEDPYLVSQLGAAMVKGLQDEHVVSTLKHFAVHSVPKGGRDKPNRTDPHVTPREVRTLFLPPFKAAIKAGARGVMSSYNDYNGIPVTGSYHFLTQILRQQWGFDGYVVTDSRALLYIYSRHHVQPNYEGAIKQALEAGVNVRTRFRRPSSFLQPLRTLVKDGEISMGLIDKRVRDVLRVKFWEGGFDHPYVNASKSSSKVRTPQAQALSLEAAEKSLVLLKNENHVLPLDASKLNSVFVAGPNANLDKKIVNGKEPAGVVDMTSVLEGIKQKVLNATEVTYVKGPDVRDKNFPLSDVMSFSLSQQERTEVGKASRAARQSDVAIVVVGTNDEMVGEGHSRVSLNLPGHQLALVKAIQKTGTPTVVVMMNGRPLSTNWIDGHVPSILEAWFPGARAGEAIANALFGDYNPGGRLPITFPKSAGQIPLNFSYNPASQSNNPDSKHGKARVRGPLYPFGHGLSYTDFKYSDISVSSDSIHAGGSVQVSLDVTNTGKRKGDEVVQLYTHEKTTPVITPVKQLRGFKRITLDPGQKKTVSFTLKPKDLQLLDKNMHWRVAPGNFEVMIGSSSVDIRQKASFRVYGEDANTAYSL